MPERQLPVSRVTGHVKPARRLAVNASEAYTLFRVTAMGTHQQTSHDLPHPTKVVPFGNYGAGLWTGHPIGLVIVIGLLFMGFVGLPET